MDLSKSSIAAGLLVFGLLGFILTISHPATAGVSDRNICGDVNGDTNIDLLDITFLISYLYMGGPAPGDLEMCDVNNSGGINILDITYLIAFLYRGGPEPDCDYVGPGGSIVATEGCKTFTAKGDYPSNVDCLEWEYLDNWVLNLKHVNAGFNCCPDIHANFYISNDTIIIEEYETFESGGPCYCLCLFDVDYSLTTIPAGEYFIKIIGMYLEFEPDTLQFTVDLAQNPTGVYCVDRTHYPWGVPDPSIYGEMTGTTGCLLFSDRDTTLTQDCIVYSYGFDSTLTLNHLNDLFNCCPDELYAEIDVVGNQINIVEWEDITVHGGCDCTCLFNLDYAFHNLPPGTWTIRVDNPYYYGVFLPGDAIEFEVNLTPGATGYFCVNRPYLPWIW